MITAVITAAMSRSFAPTKAINRPTGQKSKNRKPAWAAKNQANPQLVGGVSVNRKDTAQKSTAPAWNRTRLLAT